MKDAGAITNPVTDNPAGAHASSNTTNPWVLLTNDDGYGTAGIEALALELEPWARVVIMAPSQEQSACSHQLTLGRPLTCRSIGPNRYIVDGTPADCVYLAVYGVGRWTGEPVQLVVSGINAGPNLGLDTHYSGTVAAAREGAIRGVPSLAFSADVATDLKKAARLCSQLARQLWHLWSATMPGKRPPLVNVNLPARGAWSLRKTRLGWRTYGEGIDVRKNPRGHTYIWLGGAGHPHDDLTPGTDTMAHREGNVSITALPLVPTDNVATDIVDSLIEQVGHETPCQKDRDEPERNAV